MNDMESYINQCKVVLESQQKLIRRLKKDLYSNNAQQQGNALIAIWTLDQYLAYRFAKDIEHNFVNKQGSDCVN